MSTEVPVITIDGPGGAGKGTISMALAAHLGWHYLDSGALYRVLGLAAQLQGVDADDESGLEALARTLPVRFEPLHDGVKVMLNDRDVSADIRTEQAGNQASKVAVVPAARAALLQRQRDFARSPGLVADGRDMGTTVFPQAPLKIFLTASAEERAKRRYKQLKEKGIEANIAALSAEIAERDARDQQRASSPLVAAEDARLLDSSNMDISEVLKTAIDWTQETCG